MIKKLFIAMLLGGFFMFINACDNTEKEPLENGLLFEVGVDEYGNNLKFYNYAPTIFEEDNVRHLYYCSNQIAGNVTDYIAYRKGVQNKNGVWEYTEVSYVLSPTEGTWDERHVCDPTVIKGVFNYKGEEYYYLMAYLGCVTSNNEENETGLALAKTPDGPWIKYTDNPIVSYERNTDEDVVNSFQWGTGQPSLVSVDKIGEVLLFYTVGNGYSTFTTVRRYNFSNMDSPELIEEANLPTRGVLSQTGQPSPINNADFVYDETTNRFYVITDDYPRPTSEPSYISTANQILYIYDNSDEIGSVFFNPQGKGWNLIDRINEDKTGFARNHNTSFITDPYGHTLDSSNLGIVYTSGIETGNFWNSLSNYRLYYYNFPILE